MAKPIAPDYGQVFLFPPALEDWIPQDHYVRFLREFVDSLDLAQLGFVIPDGNQGRPPYAPSLLLKLWLFGYVNKTFSTRNLERQSIENLALIWLLGNLRPDHNSIWRFWRDNKTAIGEVFKKSVALAIHVGLVGFVLQAVDGTKIQAVASNYSGWSQEWMKEKLKTLDAEIQHAEAQIQNQEQQEMLENTLPAHLTEKKALRDQIQTGLKELEKTHRQYYHPQEPQSHRMQCEGRNRFAYNAQAVADSKSLIITAAEVTANETDVGQLVPMLKKAQANTGQSTACAVGDTHYGTAEDLARAREAGFSVIAPVCEGKAKKGNPFHASEFSYDEGTNQVKCPQGQMLRFEREKDRPQGRVKLYRCHCKTCPVRDQCTKDKRGRMIEIGPHYRVVLAQRQRLQDPEDQALLKKRRVIIEPVFSIVKQLLGFRRWTMRGMINVSAQWSLVCLSVNLLGLWKVWKQGGFKMT